MLSVLFEAIRFFQKVPLLDFLFGLTWSPQTAIREDQVGSSGSFGAVPLFTGTLMISGIAMLVALPLGLMVAIYMSEYVSPRIRAIVKPLLEVLAGIPTVVYGYFAALTVAQALVERLGEEYLTLVPETLPFVVEVLEDMDEQVESAARSLVAALECLLGESLNEYLTQ